MTGGAAAAADTAVFFVHPTTDLSPLPGNAAYDAGGPAGRRLDQGVLKFQAGVFNDGCVIYAPRYRQASLRAITHERPADLAAVELAYGDVQRAFDEFLARIGARAFIIASHSQGPIHALRLLQQQVIGTPLHRRLIVAYAIGTSLPRAIDARGLPIPAPVAAVRRADCVDGDLAVDSDPAQQAHFNDALSRFGIDHDHDYDYAQFYGAIRANAAQRIAAYRRAHPGLGR